MTLLKSLIGAVQTINVTELQDQLKEKTNFILLDIRSTSAYREGHIPGATSIPLDKLDERMHKLSKRHEIICISQSGNRSKRAARQLNAAGYDAINMKGGMSAWGKAGLKTKTGKAK